jgi:hypothetical protein
MIEYRGPTPSDLFSQAPAIPTSVTGAEVANRPEGGAIRGNLLPEHHRTSHDMSSYILCITTQHNCLREEGALLSGKCEINGRRDAAESRAAYTLRAGANP